MKLSANQQHTVDGTIERIKKGYKLTSIGGLAGTGKSVVIGEIIKQSNFNYLVLTPTGKAAHVLMMKGVPATTIHSFLYNHKGTIVIEGKEIMVWEDKKKLNRKPTVVFVDEYSMVTLKMHNDLMSKDFQLVCIGDHGQLPPIGGDPKVMANPTFKLEKIFRQKGGNDIIDFAHCVREGKDWERDWKNVELLYCDLDEFAEEHSDLDQVICGMNATRVEMNKKIRGRLGFPESAIRAGDRIICLRNNKRYGIFNGQQFRINEGPIEKGEGFFFSEMQDELGNVAWTQISLKGFNQKTVLNKEEIPQKHVLADMGYCITAHKSQGSQWETVGIINEECAAWDHKRWLYTAATRASKELVVVV